MSLQFGHARAQGITNSFLPRPIGKASSTSLPPHLPRITSDDDARDNGPASDEDDGNKDLVPTDPALQALDGCRVLRRGQVRERRAALRDTAHEDIELVEEVVEGVHGLVGESEQLVVGVLRQLGDRAGARQEVEEEGVVCSHGLEVALAFSLSLSNNQALLMMTGFGCVNNTGRHEDVEVCEGGGHSNSPPRSRPDSLHYVTANRTQEITHLQIASRCHDKSRFGGFGKHRASDPILYELHDLNI
jgi:hypothetical protein